MRSVKADDCQGCVLLERAIAAAGTCYPALSRAGAVNAYQINLERVLATYTSLCATRLRLQMALPSSLSLIRIYNTSLKINASYLRPLTGLNKTF